MCSKERKEIYVRNGYIEVDSKKKIFPFQFEDLNKIYNLARFPDRKRRNPKALRKYNFFGNIYILVGYKYVESRHFQKGDVDFIANKISEIIAIPKGTIKAKISQLKAYVRTDEKICSYDLIKIYKRFENVSYSQLQYALSVSEDLVIVKKELDILENFFKQKEDDEINKQEVDEFMKDFIIMQNIEKQGVKYYIN